MARYPAWIYRQSAALPYRSRDGKLEVLLITSRSGKRWVIPKGIVEPGLSPWTSAAKEAREEAGIEGRISTEASTRYRQDKWGGTCRIDVYPMRVDLELDDWPEATIRKRKWFTPKAAAKRLERKKLQKAIRSLSDVIGELPDGEAAPTHTATQSPRLIHLLRHAKSSWDDPALADFDRPLAPRGQAACKAMSNYLRLADIEPGLVICSSAARARETIEGLRSALSEETKVRYDKQVYLGGARALLTRLRRVPEGVSSVMLVGHNPTLEILALQLVGGGDSEAQGRMVEKFPTGALATLVVGKGRWKDLEPGDCELHSFVTPRDLP